MVHARAARRPCALCALLLLVVDTTAKEQIESQEAHHSRPTPAPQPSSHAPAPSNTAAARVLPTVTKKQQSLQDAAVPDVDLILSHANVPATFSQAQKAASYISLATTVLEIDAMCDSLVCPAGYQLRPSAFARKCTSSENCSLDADLDRCCQQKDSWWTYMMAELAFFCCLSMLCSSLGGLFHHYFPMPSSREEAKERRRASMREEAKELDEEEKQPLDGAARDIGLQPKSNETSLPVMPMAVTVAQTSRMVSGSFGQVSQGSFLSPPGSQASSWSTTGSQHQLMRPGTKPLPTMPQIGAGFTV